MAVVKTKLNDSAAPYTSVEAVTSGVREKSRLSTHRIDDLSTQKAGYSSKSESVVGPKSMKTSKSQAQRGA